MVNCSENMALSQEGTTRLKLVGPVMTPDGVPYPTRLDGLCAPEEATLIQIVRAVCTLDDIEHVRRTT
jgi:hypothetical protein